MINQRRAFNRYTTTSVLFAEPIGGYWDADNQWIVNAMGPVIKINATPLPYGNREEGVFGEQLKANPELERIPAFMGFHSTHAIPIKSLLAVYGTTYLVLQHGHYEAAGFQKVIAAKVQNLVLQESVAIVLNEDHVNQFIDIYKLEEQDIRDAIKKRGKKRVTQEVAGWD